MVARRTVDVAVVHRGAGLGRGDDDLLGAVCRSAGIHLDQLTDVGVRRHTGLRGKPGDGEELGRLTVGRVPEEYSDAERSGGQFTLDQGQPLDEFTIGGGALPCVVPQHREAAPDLCVGLDTGEHLGSGATPRGGKAVVQRASVGGGLGIRPPDGHESRFQVEGRRHTVHGLQPLPRDGVHVAVQVDEPRTDDQPRDVDDLASRRRVEPCGDSPDHAVGHEDVGNAVEPCSRINDTAATQ